MLWECLCCFRYSFTPSSWPNLQKKKIKNNRADHAITLTQVGQLVVAQNDFVLCRNFDFDLWRFSLFFVKILFFIFLVFCFEIIWNDLFFVELKKFYALIMRIPLCFCFKSDFWLLAPVFRNALLCYETTNKDRF